MTMNFDELCKRARELATNGANFQDVLFDDEIHESYCELSRSRELDKDKLEAAFVEGRRIFRVSEGWVFVWTTARADYDQFDTDEIEVVDWNDKTLRRVLVNPVHLDFQRSRYVSGAWCWDEDPRETERKIQERIAKDRAEFEEKAKLREAGLIWIRSIDLSYTDEDAFNTELRLRGLTWKDLREEEKRRDEEAEAKERAIEWERCRSTFPDGCTIIDPGHNSIKGTHPTEDPSIPGSDCAIYRSVRVVPHWSAKDSVHDAIVEGDRHELVGSLWRVAEYLKRGILRIADPSESLPPAAVLDRLKPSRLERVVRVECEGRVVWAMREKYSWSRIVVLDEQGKLVRKKSLKEAAENAVRSKEGW
jgi:hypothetical protein